MDMIMEGRQKHFGDLLRLKDNFKVSILSVISSLKFVRKSKQALIVSNGFKIKILRQMKSFGHRQTSSSINKMVQQIPFLL